MSDHPVRLVVNDDLQRSRLTVFFRLLLAIPLIIWFGFWSLLVFVVVVVGWFVALFTGRLSQGMHGFIANYIRFSTHLGAYLSLVANNYPPFGGDEAYELDVLLPQAQAQSRLRTFFRLPLALPALLLGSVLTGGTTSFAYNRSGGRRAANTSGGAGLIAAIGVLGWFSSLARGRMPSGLRDAGAYALGYRAQGLAYVLLLTDVYPNADPTAMLATVERPPVHPVHLVGDPDDLRRSRVTVLFRLLLAVPHLVWLVLWSILVFFVAIAQWAVTLIRGVPAAGLHRFLSRYVRYTLHVYAFLLLTANPFPGFAGESGLYPIDVDLPLPERQGRWSTAFRIVLIVPAAIVTSALNTAAFAAAFFMWFYALARGSAPWGMRNLSAYALRYGAQVSAYGLFVTGAYPHASPLEGAAPVELEPVPALTP